jgi:hypothetical protein
LTEHPVNGDPTLHVWPLILLPEVPKFSGLNIFLRMCRYPEVPKFSAVSTLTSALLEKNAMALTCLSTPCQVKFYAKHFVGYSIKNVEPFTSLTGQ